MGGVSSEREISFIEGREIIEKIDKDKYDVKEIIINSKKDVIDKIKNIDFALLTLFGKFGEDGNVQAILESMNIPYSGSGMLTSALCMNKNLTKTVLERNFINTAKWVEIKNIDEIDYNRLDKIGYPLIIKPNKGGSGISTLLIHNQSEVKKAIEDVLQIDECAMVEKYIQGDEYTTFMLNKEVFPTISIKSNTEIFDYNSKYISKDTEKTICNITSQLEGKINEVCKKCWDIFGCEVYVRIDFIVNEDDIYILELNTLPCTRQGGLVSQSISEKGMSKAELIDKIIEYSLDVVR